MDRLDPRDWRPQAFGTRRPRHLRDPLVEPLWPGVRVLAHLDRERPVRLVDPDGFDHAPEFEALARALVDAATADSIVVDGYLTDAATRTGVGISSVEPGPSVGEFNAQFFLGKTAADALAGRTPEEMDVVPRALDPVVRRTEGLVAFVAIDLLALDGEPLLDVPLLERKRILESALGEADLVRRTPFVREPVGTFLSTWRSLGFTTLAYKAANSRYTPGRPNEGWAQASLPRHR
jgi:ATP-dependent DNA ligase